MGRNGFDRGGASARDEPARLDALGTAADYFLRRGVTWVQDAWVEPHDVDTYIEAAARRSTIRMRFNLALYADPRHFDGQVLQYAEQRRRVDIAGSPRSLPTPSSSSPMAWSRTRRCAARPVPLRPAQPRNADLGR